MEKIPIEIFEKVADFFMRYGIKSQTMDDISRHLGVSKKTLYKYFADKNDLVVKTLEIFIESDCKAMEEIKNQQFDAINENFAISKHVLNQFKNIHPSVWYDLEKYHPQAMQKMDDFTNQTIYAWVCENLKKGMDEGLFRNDIKIPIIAGIYISRIKDFFNPLFFQIEKYSFAEIYVEAFRYHIRGIASEKGLGVLKEKVKKEKESLNGI